MYTTQIKTIVNNYCYDYYYRKFLDEISNNIEYTKIPPSPVDIMKKAYDTTFNIDYVERIEKALPKIFNFDYEIPKNFKNFKNQFETNFCIKFMNSEIAFESVEVFLLKLREKIQSIMPFYAIQFDVYSTLSYENLLDISEENTKSKNKSENSSDSLTSSDSKGLASQFPKDLINYSDFYSIEYADNGTRSIDESHGKNSSKSNSDTEVSVVRKTGNYFKYLENLKNIQNLFDELYKEFENLFLFIW